MIYDNAYITELIDLFYLYQDEETLAEILGQMKQLIEIQASKFNPEDRDDLMQEAYVRIINVLQNKRFDTSRNGHKYFTSVIYNIMASYYKKDDNHESLPELEILQNPYKLPDNLMVEDISELIAHVQGRFPDKCPDMLEIVVTDIFCRLQDEGKTAGIIKELSERFELKRSEVMTYYHVIIVYLRIRSIYILVASDFQDQDHTDSIIPEFQEIVGIENWKLLSTIFQGISIRF